MKKLLKGNSHVVCYSSKFVLNEINNNLNENLI